MTQLEIPCPVCCKHVVIDPKVFTDGGIVQCRKCRNRIKIRSHKPKVEVPSERNKK